MGPYGLDMGHMAYGLDMAMGPIWATVNSEDGTGDEQYGEHCSLGSAHSDGRLCPQNIEYAP